MEEKIKAEETERPEEEAAAETAETESPEPSKKTEPAAGESVEESAPEEEKTAECAYKIITLGITAETVIDY